MSSRTRVMICIACVILLLASLPPAISANPSPPASPVKLIFIHHSCGANWLSDGNGGLGIGLRDAGYYVSDTHYGWGPDGIGSNTDIGHWWTWFQGPSSPTYTAALYAESDQMASYSRLPTDPGGENQIILFKSCYPNSAIAGEPDEPPTTGDNPLRGQSCGSAHMTVGNAKGIYQDLLTYFATRQDKLFVVVTAPPLVSSGQGANARALNDWLVHDWLSAYPHDNVAVFDFYNVLTSNGGDSNTNDLGAVGGNHHRWYEGAEQHTHPVDYDLAAYGSGGDSHPTSAGNRKATGEFIALLNSFYNRWTGTTPVETTTPTATATAMATVTATATPTPDPTITTTSTSTPNPTVTETPTSGEHTLVLQSGNLPTESYSGARDVILAADAAANANLGSAENLEVFWGDSSENRRSLLFWDLSPLPARATVQSAQVELYHYQAGADYPQQVALYQMSGDWAEGTGWDLEPDVSYEPDGATWTLASPGNPWITPGGDFAAGVLDQTTLAVDQATGWVSLDATAAVLAWASGAPNDGLLLRPLDGLYTYHYFYSREHAIPSQRPRLVITFTYGQDETPMPTPTATNTPVMTTRFSLPLILKQ